MEPSTDRPNEGTEPPAPALRAPHRHRRDRGRGGGGRALHEWRRRRRGRRPPASKGTRRRAPSASPRPSGRGSTSSSRRRATRRRAHRHAVLLPARVLRQRGGQRRRYCAGRHRRHDQGRRLPGPEQDAILDYITAAIKNEDTTEQVKETFRGYDEIFGDLYQTYGRKVEIEFVQARAPSSTRWRRGPMRSGRSPRSRSRCGAARPAPRRGPTSWRPTRSSA